MASPRMYATYQRPDFAYASGDRGPDLDTPQGAAEYAQEWDDYTADLDEALSQSAGFEREKLAAQLKDAEAGRANAYKIAQLQASTSRYGVDKNFESAMRQLKENARQFDLNHALEKEKFAFEKEKFGKDFGLRTAEAYTRYSQTPDMIWALNDFKGAMNRVGLGREQGAERPVGPAPVSTSASRPTPKDWESFAALQGFNTPVVQAGQTTPGVGAGAAVPAGGFHEGGAGPGGPATDVDGDGVPDPRPKAVRAIMDAIPASESQGTDEQDWAALNAIRNIYFAGRPGSVERLGEARRKTAQAGLARLGYDPNLVEEDYQRSLPGQRSVRSRGF